MRVAREQKNSADFAVCYLEEAHPISGWMYGAVTRFIEQHTKLSERRAAACTLRSILLEQHGISTGSDMPMVVDLMDNAVSVYYGALPERLVILRDGVVEWVGGKGPEDYDVEEMRAALAALLR